MPAVRSSGNPFKGRAVLDGSNAPILCAVAFADIDGTTAADNTHQFGQRLLIRGFICIRLFLASIRIGDSIRQFLVCFTAVDAVLLDARLCLKLFECCFGF